MSNWFWLLLVCSILLAFGYALRRERELFALSAVQGKLTVLRGRLPQALFSALSEIVARERLDRAELRVVSESGSPRLQVLGAGHAGLEQAARNVLGKYNVAQIRHGRLRAR